MGAWIETYDTVDDVDNNTSHPMWVRGLKRQYSSKVLNNLTSHPMWVRGLKHPYPRDLGSVCLSHPMWVRGLKLFQKHPKIRHSSVAPYVGAWIET